jgi:predicted nucleic acid-binding protein
LIALDTNLLAYAVDTRAGERHLIAKALLKQVIANGSLFLPLQVTVEFFNVIVRRLRWPPQDAIDFVEDWKAAGTVIAYNGVDADRAMRANQEHGLPVWDALIWAVCDRAGVEVLASEDFQNGRRLGRVTFLSPFDPANAPRLGLGASG